MEEMAELKLMVPTYVAELSAQGFDVGDDPDFGDPHVPVVVQSAAGVRVVLGSHAYDDCKTPDIQIERRPGGWAIFLHPLAGSDPSGYVYFLDDGRSFLLPEHLGATERIKVIHSVDDLPELDLPPPSFCVREVAKGPESCCADQTLIALDSGQVGSKHDPNTPTHTDLSIAKKRKFHFEIGASVSFAVEADSENEAHEKAEHACDELFGSDRDLGFPPEYQVRLALEESSPDLVEELPTE